MKPTLGRHTAILSTLLALAGCQSRGISPAEGTLTVVTYNIKHGRGMDDVVDLDRTASVLRNLDADVVGLQEVDRLVERSGRVNQHEFLGNQLEMESAFGAFMDYQGGEYGMAILSRYRIIRSERIRLPAGNEPRIALAVDIQLPAGDTLTVVNVHFDWVEDDGFRFAQASLLREWLDAASYPVILLGDFNDEPASRTLGLFADYLPATKPNDDRFTFSSTEPIKEIDFIFFSPRDSWNVTDTEVIDEPLASDHRPVRTIVEVGW